MKDAKENGRNVMGRISNRLDPLITKAEQAIEDLYRETEEIAEELGIPKATFERLKQQQEKKKLDFRQRQEAILIGGEFEAPLLARVTHTGQPTP